jgi:hypothetical protein
MGFRWSIHVDVRCLRSEEFLACLSSDSGVVQRQNNITNRNLSNALMLLQSRRKIVLLYISRPVPRSKETVLSEVSI